MPEGDSLHRAARALQVLVGETVEAEVLNPRAAVSLDAASITGRRLESVEAVGKNLLLHFEGGLVVRSHLRMSGRWRVEPRGPVAGWPWLVLRGREQQAVLRGGPVLELQRGSSEHTRVRGVGPDILAEPPDFEAMVENLRAADPARELGETLLDQRLVAGIGNLWRAEALWHARVSPWRKLAETSDEELRAVLDEAHRLMRASLDGRQERRIYRRPVCPRCNGRIASRGQGEDNRTAYWCPACQR